jgi:hypothetical protein
LRAIKPNGVLFIEGPLETNPSLINWTSRIFGAIKRKVRPEFIAKHPPTHLYLTGASQQFAFFLNVEPALSAKRYDVFETGWPYVNGGIIKRTIAFIARRFLSKKIFGISFGNRLRGIFSMSKEQVLDNALTQTIEIALLSTMSPLTPG